MNKLVNPGALAFTVLLQACGTQITSNQAVFRNSAPGVNDRDPVAFVILSQTIKTDGCDATHF